MSKAKQSRRKHPDAARNAAVSFAADLETGELLTGTPTVSAAPSGLTISNERVNTAAITVDGEETAIGEAVQFKVAGGTSGTIYLITVTCGTTSSPSQTLVAECTLTVT